MTMLRGLGAGSVRPPDKIRELFSDLFSRTISPSSFLVLEFHIAKKLGVSSGRLRDEFEKRPRDVYEALCSLYGEDTIKYIDIIFSSYLRREMDINLDRGVLELLREGDVGKLGEIADTYLQKLSVKKK